MPFAWFAWLQLCSAQDNIALGEISLLSLRSWLYQWEVKQRPWASVTKLLAFVVFLQTARLLTVKREREIAEGIKPRESRKKSKALEHARGGWWKVANIPDEFKYLTTPAEGDSVVEI